MYEGHGILPKEALAAHILQRLNLEGCRLELMHKAGEETLHELGVRLLDPTVNRQVVYRWLTERLGEEVANGTYYRFVEHFSRAGREIQDRLLVAAATGNG